jgi:acyl-coenzyme A synthetase/AMP-(fatty) acid ligase/thioesterase domain-containing protein
VRLSASSRLRNLAVEDPERPAIVARDRQWTYAELDAAVERVARWLYARRTSDSGIGVVALRFRGTVPLIISSLALSRSGVVCALIDPLAPAARVRLVLDDLLSDGAPALLITDLPDDVGEHPGSVLFDDVPGEVSSEAVPEHAELDVDDLHSIVFTSGSTGVPMGVRVTGRSRAAIDDWVTSFDGLRDRARVGAIAAGTIGQGAELPRLVVASGATMLVHDVLADGLDTIPRWLTDQRVELVALVPTLIRFLMPLLDEQLGPDGVLPDLKIVAVWGESSDWNDITQLSRHLRPDALIHNAYGSTETPMLTALSFTAAEVGPVGGRTGPVPAGLPMPDVTIRIVDEHGSDLPAGENGEIVVATPHLADGYWRRPDLTASVYATDENGQRIARTGDGGRLDADGVLHVTGRLDNVVKISGHRIALGELEQAAREQPGVASAAAVARADPHGAMRLHLYVVPRPRSALETRWLRAAIARSLPPAALPDTVDVLDALPLLGNGKVDRRSLPEPAARETTAAPPDAALAGQLAELFAEVLGGGAVAADDDFFELGGDSLRAGRLVALLQSRLGHLVPTSLLLEASTPMSLAAALAGSQEAMLVPVRTAGSGVPLFVIHGGEGEVLFARRLAAHLDPETPVYALQPPPLRSPRPFVPTLREMAERYVAEIRRVWPHGPYQLFGYSMGGIIAVEMATLLEDSGDKIDLVALGDTLSPDLLMPVRQQQTESERRTRAARSVGAKVREQLAHRRSQVRRRAARAPMRTVQWHRFLRGDEPEPEIRADAYLHVYGRLAAEHRFQRPFDGDVTLIRATQGFGPPDRGWPRHIAGAVRTVEIDVRHEELILEPAIAELARALAPFSR